MYRGESIIRRELTMSRVIGSGNNRKRGRNRNKGIEQVNWFRTRQKIEKLYLRSNKDRQRQ
jgi:hypothetical protein